MSTVGSVDDPPSRSGAAAAPPWTRRRFGWHLLWYLLLPSPLLALLSGVSAALPLALGEQLGWWTPSTRIDLDVGVLMFVAGAAPAVAITAVAIILIGIFARPDIRARVVWLSIVALCVVVPVLSGCLTILAVIEL